MTQTLAIETPAQTTARRNLHEALTFARTAAHQYWTTDKNNAAIIDLWLMQSALCNVVAGIPLDAHRDDRAEAVALLRSVRKIALRMTKDLEARSEGA